MMEDVLTDLPTDAFFTSGAPVPLGIVALGSDPIGALNRANAAHGLALSDDEVTYLATAYAKLERDPTDVELMMFAQANSEHCRHKIFNASWTLMAKISQKVYSSGFEIRTRLHRMVCCLRMLIMRLLCKVQPWNGFW